MVRRLIVGIDGEDVPEGGVNRVVTRYHPGMIGEVIGQQPISNITREGRENSRSVFCATRSKRQSREGDHRVPPPVIEPVVASDDCLQCWRSLPGLSTLICRASVC